MHNTIHGEIGIGTDLVKSWNRARCARVYTAARAALRAMGWAAEDEAWFKEHLTTAYAGGQSQLVQTCEMQEITEAQAWTTFILWELKSKATTKTHLPASEETRMWDPGAFGEMIYDERSADAVLRQVLAA